MSSTKTISNQNKCEANDFGNYLKHYYPKIVRFLIFINCVLNRRSGTEEKYNNVTNAEENETSFDFEIITTQFLLTLGGTRRSPSFVILLVSP